MGELEVKALSGWSLFSGTGPYVISGPCSAESRLQVVETARQLCQEGVSMFRAGVWKPRTRPGTFAGAGKEGLEWLLDARRETGIGICAEVATPQHVESCLEAGLDAVWIGARTTANPFLVQEIAEALSGSGIPVLVKNPVNPDVALWLGALERMRKAGLDRIAAIHRGFSTIEATAYRNDPLWSVALQLRSLCPGLPMFCDPSHMGGKVSLVAEISQKAMDLGYDGLMIESHCDPGNALSDASQQLTPSELGKMLKSLTLRNNDSSEDRYKAILREERAKIDIIDESLLRLLASRMEASRTIGEAKKEHNIAIFQQDRWKDVLALSVAKGRELGLNDEFVRKLMILVHEASVEEQNKILSEK